MNTFNTSSCEYWMLEAFKALEKNESDTARVFSEKAVEIDNKNLDAHFLFLITLIKEIDNPSIHKLETNLEKSDIEINILREMKRNGELTERQEIKFQDLSKEQFDFFDYVQMEISKINNSF